MSRAVEILRAAAWWGSVAAALLWWLPSIAGVLLAWGAGRLRFRLAIGAAAVLREVGAVGAARWIYTAERDRAGRRLAALRARRPKW